MRAAWTDGAMNNLRSYTKRRLLLGILVLSPSWLEACTSSSTPDEKTESPQLNASATTNPEAEGCSSDTECQTGFCDRGSCAEPDIDGNRYGADCAENSLRDECGGYLCQDGRCRSCASDNECTGGNARGSARCYAYDERPGRSCGLPPPDGGTDQEVMPPPNPAGGFPADDAAGSGGGGMGGRGLVGTMVDPPPDTDSAGAAGAPSSE